MVRNTSSAPDGQLIQLAWILGSLGGACALAGVILLNVGHVNDTPTELGKWVLQLALVLVGTGVVGIVVRQVELLRAQRESWTDLLQEVVAAHDSVQLASRLLSAHRTAKTYNEQIERLSDVREVLRRVMSSPAMHNEAELRAALAGMRKYLKHLVQEYQAKYLAIARQQRLDEAVLTFRLSELAKQSREGTLPQIPDYLAKATPAGEMLRDKNRLPRLNEFQDAFMESQFRRSYELAKPLLEAKAGVIRQSP